MANMLQTITAWLQDTILKVTPDGSLCGALELFHVNLAGNTTLQKHLISANTETTSKELGNMFFNIAKHHAAGQFNQQQYKILAYHPDEDQPYTEHPFILNGQADMDAGTPETSKTGVLKQMMDFYQAGMTSVFQQQKMLFETQGAVIGMIAKENTALKAENHTATVMFKEMLFEKAQGQHEHQIELIKMKERSDLQNKIAEIVPFIINSLAGREIIPSNASDTSLLNTIADNITSDQIKMIPELFPELGGFIAARLQQRIDEKNLLKHSDGMTEALAKTDNRNGQSS